MVEDRRDAGFALTTSAAIAGTAEAATRAPQQKCSEHGRGPSSWMGEAQRVQAAASQLSNPRRPEPRRFRMLGNKRTLVERGAEVARRPVGSTSRRWGGCNRVGDEVAERQAVRPGDLDRRLARGSKRDIGERCGYIGGGDRLEVGVGNNDAVACDGSLGNRGDETRRIASPGRWCRKARSAINRSCATFARKFPFPSRRSVPTMDRAT